MRRLVRLSRIVCVCGATAACFLLAQGNKDPVPVVASQIPHLVPPRSPSRVPLDFWVFSWDEFIALNWPALVPAGSLPQRGVPDTKKKPGDLGSPRVWETWKADYELYLDQTGHNPPLKPTAWSSWDLPEQICSSSDGATRVLPMVAKGESVFPGGLNQAMGGPLVDQHGKYVRYEVRLNETEYDETVDKTWYLRKNLSVYPKAPSLFTASTADRYGAIELKASWRIMTPQETAAKPPRYYITKARVVDPKTHKCSDQPVDVGLVGFHIAHKSGTFDAWVWTTFEQVDNVPADGMPPPTLGYSFNNGKPPSTPLKIWGFSPNSAKAPIDAGSLKPEPTTPVEMIRINPIQAGIAALNNQVHQMTGVKGTVWENYELVETQWQRAFPSPIKVSNPGTNEDLYQTELNAIPMDRVANTTMETFYQGKAGAPDPSPNSLGLPTLGTSCLHCHYAAAQYDFSWVMADAAWPSSPATQSKIAHIPHKK
jgi:hypothetical protein